MKSKISDVDLRRIAELNNFKGDGSETTPFIFQNYKAIPENLIIRDSSLYLVFENSGFNNLAIENCKNMSFKDCYFIKLEPRYCNSISIEHCEIGVLLLIKKSNKINLNNSDLGKLHLLKSHDCLIKNSRILIASVKFSLGNSFEKIHIEEFKPTQLVKGGQKWEILKIRTLIYCFLIIIFLFILQYEPWRYEPLYFILGSILIIIPAGRLGLALYSNYILNKLREKFGLNVLISLQ